MYFNDSTILTKKKLERCHQTFPFNALFSCISNVNTSSEKK